MKPSTHDWGDIRSALHEPGLGLMERARRLERALSPEHAKEVRCYILDHVPTWAPKSLELPYVLARAWMSGELPNLLGALCEDEELVELIAREQPLWREVTKLVDYVVAEDFGGIRFAPVSLENAWCVEERLDAMGQLEEYFWVLMWAFDVEPDMHGENWRRHKSEILRGGAQCRPEYEFVEEFRPGYTIQLEDEASSPCSVTMSIFEDSYALAFDLSDLDDEDVPELFAMLRLGGLLHRCEPNFDFVLHPNFKEGWPDDPVYESFEEVCETLEQMWAVYRRLCL